MVTEFVPEEAPLAFADIANLFLSYGTFMSPAFHDGRLVAALALSTAADSTAAAEQWLQGMAEVLGVESPRSREDAELLLQWRARTRQSLASEDMSFTPLLPDTLFSVAERVRGLQEWAQGFGEVLDEYGVDDDDTLSAPLKEALHDLRAIADSNAADEFEAAGFDDQGEHEEDLSALHEHLRMAVIMLWLERHPGRPSVDQGEPTPTVH